jgi:hypothetical protein
MVLDLRKVVHQTEQRHRGRRDGPLRQLCRGELHALHCKVSR